MNEFSIKPWQRSLAWQEIRNRQVMAVKETLRARFVERQETDNRTGKITLHSSFVSSYIVVVVVVAAAVTIATVVVLWWQWRKPYAPALWSERRRSMALEKLPCIVHLYQVTLSSSLLLLLLLPPLFGSRLGERSFARLVLVWTRQQPTKQRKEKIL